MSIAIRGLLSIATETYIHIEGVDDISAVQGSLSGPPEARYWADVQHSNVNRGLHEHEPEQGPCQITRG